MARHLGFEHPQAPSLSERVALLSCVLRQRGDTRVADKVAAFRSGGHQDTVSLLISLPRDFERRFETVVGTDTRPGGPLRIASI